MAYSFKNWLNSAKHLNGADKQMSFQSAMSGSAHQREIEDLKAAGLNPVLSANGQGASTPTGAYDETANSASSGSGGGYRIASKAISLADKGIDKIGSALKEAIDAGSVNSKTLSIDKGLSLIPDHMPLVQTKTPPVVSFNIPEKVMNAKMGEAFNKRYVNNQLTFNDVKDYVTKANGTKWFDIPIRQSVSIGNNGASNILKVGNAAWSGLGTDFAKNYRSIIFSDIRKHMSKSEREELDRWIAANKYGQNHYIRKHFFEK